jgi:poly-gamma-glutamate synthesis protein (capsule biosynthesis protein)
MSAAQDTLTITFTGDILLDRGVRQRINAIGIDSLFTPEIDSIFTHSDIVVGNLECPATSTRTPAMKQFVFRGEPEWLEALRRHGITHLNLANNHSVDQRRKGLISTVENCRKAGIVPVGMGKNLHEAVQPVLLTPPPSTLIPQPIYLFPTLQLPLENFTYLPDEYSVSQESIDSLCQRISRLRQAEPTAYIIVSPHWGIEHRVEPAQWQRRQARALIDAGADIIVGHHTHTLQTIENYKGKPIYYSIGNFIFDQTKPINTRTCLVQIRIAPTSVEVETIPIEINRCTPEITGTVLRDTIFYKIGSSEPSP